MKSKSKINVAKKTAIFSPALSEDELVERSQYLELQQQEYEFTHEYIEGMGLLKNVPLQENFSTAYIADREFQLSGMTINMLTVEPRSFLNHLGEVDELGDYKELYQTIPEPGVSKNYQTDRAFAEQRLSGVNPLVIKNFSAKMSAGVDIFLQDLGKETEALFSSNATNLQEEIKQGHIFIADYAESFSFVEGGTYGEGRKYLPKPIAFFWWRKDGIKDRGELVPIAIKLNTPDKGWKIFTPLDKDLDWSAAKLCVQIADANHHQLSSHLGRTHLVLEPFVISTARQLAKNHPLGMLLRQHFRFLIAVNDLARRELLNQGGFVELIFAGSLPESLRVVQNACASWNIKDFALPTEIENRGMDEKDDRGNYKLPHYPYRDDGLLIWNAIEDFVTNYLKVFYPKLEDIQNDRELQKWAAELASADGGKVSKMPEKISSIEELIEIVTTIIYICGPQHSAVNFPQYEYMGFIPNMPLAGYQEITGAEDQFKDERDLLEFLPPLTKTATQLETMHKLSSYHYDRLGYYDEQFENMVKNTDIEPILAKFKQDLNQIEVEIDNKNKDRTIPYLFMKPSLITNSTCI